MRVMREGKTIDRAVWLAKRGGHCKEPDRLRMWLQVKVYIEVMLMKK